jgi:acetamidase/formamidase
MATEHTLDRTHIHHDWDRSREPALTIRPGDVVHVDMPITGEGQVEESSSIEDVAWDFETIYNLAGPVYVEGASAGGTLGVEILELRPGAWGWTAVIPELGLLASDFPDAFLKTFDLRNGTTAEVAPGVEVPLEPFLGTMGVPIDEAGSVSPFPPHAGGGNVDCRHLVAGSTLWLPVWCDGALFSCGDAHGVQGDGEVCVSAVECAMRATLRFGYSDRSLAGPAYQVPAPVGIPGPYRGSMGIHADLMEGARIAVRNTIAWLVEEHGMSREDAYVLCSLAGDLRIHEIVDAGVWNVGMTMPLGVFV